MNVRRSVLAVAMAIGAVLVAASPALAQFGSDPDEPFVVLTGALVVPNGDHRERRRSSSTATRRSLGDVDGQVIAFNGDVHGVRHRLGQRLLAERSRDAPRRSAASAATSPLGSSPTSRLPPRSTAALRSARGFDVNVGKPDHGEPHPRLAGHDRLVLPPGALARPVRAACRRGASRARPPRQARGVDRLRLPHAGRASRSPRSSRSASCWGSRSASACCWPSASSTGWATRRARTRSAGDWSPARGSRCWRSSRAGASCAALALIPVLASLVWLAATVWGLGALVHRGPRGRPPDGRRPGSGGRRARGIPPIPPPPPIVSG